MKLIGQAKNGYIPFVMCLLENSGLDTWFGWKNGLRFGLQELFCATRDAFDVSVKLNGNKQRLTSTANYLFTAMFCFSIQSWEVGVTVLQHFVLITVSELTCEGTVFGTALALGVLRVVFHCALAHSFVPSRGRFSHVSLLWP